MQPQISRLKAFTVASCTDQEFFCKPCNLQFDKRSVFDIHLSLVHGKDSTKENVIFVIKKEEELFSSKNGEIVWNEPNLDLDLDLDFDSMEIDKTDRFLKSRKYRGYLEDNHLKSAIEEIKRGMSGFQASRKYVVPSRTVYDKTNKKGLTMEKKSNSKL